MPCLGSPRGEEGNRTPDNPVAGRVLYLLSYIPMGGTTENSR